MQIRHETDEIGGGFYVDDKKKVIAEMTYTRQGTVMDIRHTLVDADREDEGIGRKLVDAGVQYAREKGMKITPTCSFARKIVESDYRDMLALS